MTPAERLVIKRISSVFGFKGVYQTIPEPKTFKNNEVIIAPEGKAISILIRVENWVNELRKPTFRLKFRQSYGFYPRFKSKPIDKGKWDHLEDPIYATLDEVRLYLDMSGIKYKFHR